MTTLFPQPRGPATHHRFLRSVQIILILMSLLIAPLIWHRQDVIGCGLNWAYLTGGSRPWNLYLFAVDTFGRPLNCIYPPFTLYLVTWTQWMINLLELDQFGRGAIFIWKLPYILCIPIAVRLLRTRLPSVPGVKPWQTPAGLYLLCLPIWFNAAGWGQHDALLCLADICVVIAVLRNHPFAAGLAAGWALSIKLQAIVMLPALSIYALRTWKPIDWIRLAGGAVLIWTAVSTPFFATGAGRGIHRAYFVAVDFYPLLSICAGNLWMLVQTCTARARDWDFSYGRHDDLPLIGHLTARQIGLALFALYVCWQMLILFRSPTRDRYVQATALTAFAFFMLPTQMHERYVLQACAILAFCCTSRGRLLFHSLSISALACQCVGMVFGNLDAAGPMDLATRTAFQWFFLFNSVINLLLFAWASFIPTLSDIDAQADTAS